MAENTEVSTKLTGSDRVAFATSKVGGASKWIVISGTATYFLTELLKLADGFDLPSWAVLVTYFVVNVLLYAVAKYVEGEAQEE